MGSKNPTLEALTRAKRRIAEEFPFEQVVFEGEELVARVRPDRREKFDQLIDELEVDVVEEGVVRSNRVLDELKLR